jgi:hypothetical protein
MKNRIIHGYLLQFTENVKLTDILSESRFEEFVGREVLRNFEKIYLN